MKLSLNEEARVRLINPVTLPDLGTVDAGVYGRTFPMTVKGKRYIEFFPWPDVLFPISEDDLEVVEYL